MGEGAEVRGQVGSGSAPTGPYAFLFWNDHLDAEAIRAELADLAAAGFRGVTISARIGLSREIGYLTPAFFDLVRAAVDECARLGLAVMLYDEASYPSGSANGLVVQRDPAFAARSLQRVTRDMHASSREYWRPTLGRSPAQRLLAVVAAPLVRSDGSGSGADGALGTGSDRSDDAAADGLAPGSADGLVPDVAGARLLVPNERGLVALDLPAGRWRLCAIFDAPSAGTIRGAYADTDDDSALRPAAADLLNPDAVAAFIDLTHEGYARALTDHLGTTVVAMFTDEPSMLGRGPTQGAVAYTRSFETDVAAELGADVGEVLRRLPALWDDGPADPALRRAYHVALRNRLNSVYYGAQSRWCADHGIALTGHPAKGDDLASAACFDWPGQDTVWRWVLPGDGSALAGPESTAPKGAASAAHLRGHGTAVAEVLGAYGWRLSLDEAKWLLDWYLSRGVTTLVLHAFFASVRGNRAYESEPDLGRHNSWWPHFPRLVAYQRRIADLVAAGTHTASVAVLADPDHLPDRRAGELLRAQLDFFYIDPDALTGATLDGGALLIGDQRYLAVVDDLGPGAGPDARRRLAAFAADGGLVEAYEGVLDAARLERVRAHVRTGGGLAVTVEPPAPELRVVTVRRDGTSDSVFFNEGEDAIAAWVTPDRVPARPQWLDPLTGTRQDAPTRSDGAVRLDLPRRGTAVLTEATDQPTQLPPSGAAVRTEATNPRTQRPPSGTATRTIELRDLTGTPAAALAAPSVAELGLGDWRDHPDLRLFSGSYRYVTSVDLPADVAAVVLDLGEVGQAATVVVNGATVTDLMWAPYRAVIGAEYLRAGANRLELLVSNSAAVHYEGADLPSGLIGPVTLSY
ncbi:hypothetical protein OCAE111667_04315 [Occultella aeris]|uniref:hypothetical protein n=1 Tax=Occultella aeris TaxID=2761496 RepID=UPI0012E9D5DC|nr:hypothetical protein [Occultella aeris]